jgi:hypothetical protein
VIEAVQELYDPASEAMKMAAVHEEKKTVEV